MVERAEVSSKHGSEDDAPRVLMELTSVLLKIRIGLPWVGVSSCLRASGMGYRVGILEAE